MCKEALRLMQELGNPELDSKEFLPYLTSIYDKILKSGSISQDMTEEIVFSKIKYEYLPKALTVCQTFARRNHFRVQHFGEYSVKSVRIL
jgi:hypothetical protein